jgi:hypothetical protein
MALSLGDFCDVNNLKPRSKAAKTRYAEYLNNLDLFDASTQPKHGKKPKATTKAKAKPVEKAKLAKVSIGAKLAAMRVIEKKPCAHCGKPIEGIKKKKYCDESCKQKAKYARSKNEG